MKLDKYTHSYTKEVEKFSVQTVVECRLPCVGEVRAVLAVQAAVQAVVPTVEEGGVRMGGKAIVCAVYEDDKGQICRMERGVEFSHRYAKEGIHVGQSAYVTAVPLAHSFRKEGNSLFVGLPVQLDGAISQAVEVPLVTGGEEVILKKENVALPVVLPCSGDCEVSDEFETEQLDDLLCHSESVLVEKVQCVGGGLTLSGEVAVHVCALQAGIAVNFERLLPFRAELPLSAAVADGVPCEGDGAVEGCVINLHTDEEKKRSRLDFTVTLHLSGVAYDKAEKEGAVDAYSTQYELNLEQEELTRVEEAECLSFTERIGGRAALDGKIDFSATLLALCDQRIECSLSQTDGVWEMQGVFSARLLMEEDGGLHRSVQAQLPFSLPVQLCGEGVKTCKAMVCGASLRQRGEGEADVSATVKFTVCSKVEKVQKVVCDVQEKEAWQEDAGAFSLYLPQVGLTLWEVAKSLHQRQEEITAANPQMTFPVTEGERMIVYRQRN